MVGRPKQSTFVGVHLEVSIFIWYFLASLALSAISRQTAEAQFLEQDLHRIAPQELVEMAKREGDAARGAVVFFQPAMACS